MTKDEFMSACMSAAVAPELALEDADIRAALAARDDAAVLAALIENF
jgi:hypothetical protein